MASGGFLLHSANFFQLVTIVIKDTRLREAAWHVRRLTLGAPSSSNVPTVFEVDSLKWIGFSSTPKILKAKSFFKKCSARRLTLITFTQTNLHRSQAVGQETLYRRLGCRNTMDLAIRNRRQYRISTIGISIYSPRVAITLTISSARALAFIKRNLGDIVVLIDLRMSINQSQRASDKAGCFIRGPFRPR